MAMAEDKRAVLLSPCFTIRSEKHGAFSSGRGQRQRNAALAQRAADLLI